MTTFTPVDYLVLSLSLLSAVSWIVWSVKNREKVLYAVPPLSWTANVVLFYFFHIFGMSMLVYRVWLEVIQLQVSFLLFGIGVIVLLERFYVK